MKSIIKLVMFIVIIGVVVVCLNNVKKKNIVDIDNVVECIKNNKGDISEFILDGWHLLKKSEGDLNKDNIDDVAFVIEEDSDLNNEENKELARKLIIVFGGENNTYKISIETDKAILGVFEGGTFGDPFEDIKIENGTLLISFFARWFNKYRFRYQDNDWYLIGATNGFVDPVEMHEMDSNLLTGDYIEKKTDENGKIIESKGNRGKKNLLKLSEFDATAGDSQYLMD